MDRITHIEDTFMVTEVHLDDCETIQRDERKNILESKKWVL